MGRRASVAEDSRAGTPGQASGVRAYVPARTELHQPQVSEAPAEYPGMSLCLSSPPGLSAAWAPHNRCQWTPRDPSHLPSALVRSREPHPSWKVSSLGGAEQERSASEALSVYPNDPSPDVIWRKTKLLGWTNISIFSPPDIDWVKACEGNQINYRGIKGCLFFCTSEYSISEY